jgi:uncharacterized protein (DUF2141 family)
MVAVSVAVFGATFVAMAGLLAGTAAGAADLVVEVPNPRSDDGTVIAGLHDGQTSFDNDAAIARERAPARTGGVRLVFAGLPPGRYAVVLYHDENDNRRIDRNFLGIPREGYGFSNNIRPLLSAPTFEQMAVTVGDEPAGLVIRLLY